MTPQTVGTPNSASTVLFGWKQLMYMLKYSPGRSTSTWSSCSSSSSSALPGGLTLSWTKTGRAWTSSGGSLPVRSCIQSEKKPENFSESESESASASASESEFTSTFGRWSCVQMVSDSHSLEYVRTLSTL